MDSRAGSPKILTATTHRSLARGLSCPSAFVRESCKRLSLASTHHRPQRHPAGLRRGLARHVCARTISSWSDPTSPTGLRLHSGDPPPRWLSPLNFTEILSHKTPVRAPHLSSYLCIPTEQVDRARAYPDRIRCSDRIQCSECTDNFMSA